jgi:hypothetical protein
MNTIKKLSVLLQEMVQAVKNSNKGYRLVNGAYYAHVFNNSINGCPWLANTPFSPGRWAITYQELYVLFRILQTMKPQYIMELGLGQSSIMLSRYCSFHPQVSCVTIEHDKNWVNFFNAEHQIPTNLNLKILPLAQEKIGRHLLYKYEGSLTQYASTPLELIIVDGPFGSAHNSRSQFLELIPDFINPKKFVIVVDDIERKGEKETAKLLLKALVNAKIPHKSYKYQGEKDFFVVCSPEHGFLLSL